MVQLITETEAQSCVTIEKAIDAVERIFVAVEQSTAQNFPVIREALEAFGGVFGIKSAVANEDTLLGLKAGGYWSGNNQASLPNHQSTTLLFDAKTGQPKALVSANYLTGVRTAAASAVATKYLARDDSRTLGLVGAGGQALHQLSGAMAVRPIERVVVWSRSHERAQNFASKAKNLGVDVQVMELAEVCAEADILTTITPATEPVVKREWLRQGTHINAMGADTRGKQELDIDILKDAEITVDSWEQASSLGECQTLSRRGELKEMDIQGSLGQIISGAKQGRSSANSLTVFDGTGIALQDLVVADIAVKSIFAGRQS